MKTIIETLEDYKTRYGDESKNILLKQCKSRIKVAKQSIGKSKKRLDGTGTFRGYNIAKPTEQNIIDLYNERIDQAKKIIKMWEEKIEQLNNI